MRGVRVGDNLAASDHQRSSVSKGPFLKWRFQADESHMANKKKPVPVVNAIQSGTVPVHPKAKTVPSPMTRCATYQVKAICPVATSDWTSLAEPHCSTITKLNAITVIAAPRPDRRNSGMGGMDSVPKTAVISSAFKPFG